MFAIIVGAGFVVLGFWGVVAWWQDFVIVLKGFLPVMIVFGGFFSVIAGASSVRDSIEAKSKSAEEDKKE